MKMEEMKETCHKCGVKETLDNKLGYANLIGWYICEKCMGEKLGSD